MLFFKKLKKISAFNISLIIIYVLFKFSNQMKREVNTMSNDRSLENNRAHHNGLNLRKPARAIMNTSMTAIENKLNNLTEDQIKQLFTSSPDTQLPWLYNLTVGEVSETYARICQEEGARNLIADAREIYRSYETVSQVAPSSAAAATRALGHAANAAESETNPGGYVTTSMLNEEKIDALSSAVREHVAGRVRQVEDRAVRAVIDQSQRQARVLRRTEQELEIAERAGHELGRHPYAVTARQRVSIGSGITAGTVYLTAMYLANERPGNPVVELICLGLTAPTYFLVDRHVAAVSNATTPREGSEHLGLAALVIAGSLGAQVGVRKVHARFFRDAAAVPPALPAAPTRSASDPTPHFSK